MRLTVSKFLIAVATLAAPVAASAEIRVTEFMYKGDGGEFFELTNLGDSAVDISGWYYDDNSRSPSVAIGSVFGLLAAHESIIVTESAAADFRSYWGLDASVRIFENLTVNLGSNDEINIYSSASASDLVDQISYSGTSAGTSRNRPLGVSGAVANSAFVASVTGDAYNSYFAPTSPSDLGNPGFYPFPAAVPEPASWALMIAGFGMIGTSMRRRAKLSLA